MASMADKTSIANTTDHTVIPFSLAIKRMSEILIYKANECRAKVRLERWTNAGSSSETS